MRLRATRYLCNRELEVVPAAQVSVGHLINISTSGAQLRRVGRLPCNALVILCHLNNRIPARVVWSTDMETGICFMRPLLSADMRMLRGALGGFVAPEPPINLGLKEMS